MASSQYYTLLKANELTVTPIERILSQIRKYLNITPLDQEILTLSADNGKIPSKLSNLPLYSVTGHKSWSGLMVCFPGKKDDLHTENVGTPYIRSILYPILELYRRLQQREQARMSCIYVIGDAFPDVLLRKFKLLASAGADVIVLTSNLLKLDTRKDSLAMATSATHSEDYVQKTLCAMMTRPEGLRILTREGVKRIGYISHEFRTSEGTQNPEKLDILGYDLDDKSLIAFELKGENANRVELENLFLQGLEHRNWLEVNKRSVKLMHEGPKGSKINSKKRVRLILGFFGNYVPPLFDELRTRKEDPDKHLKIDFVKLSIDQYGEILTTVFPEKHNRCQTSRKKSGDCPAEMIETVNACRKLLLMVQELHKFGYESLRIVPGMSPSGCGWRCAIVPASYIRPQHDVVGLAYLSEAQYTSADGTKYFEWDDVADDTAQQMAEKFVIRFPKLAKEGLGNDPDYVRWYDRMMKTTAPDGIVYAYADYDMPKDFLPVQFKSNLKIPLPPTGILGLF